MVHEVAFAVFTFLQFSSAGAFPIEEFKRFVNERPTIERFDFQVRSKKFRYTGLSDGTYRRFSAVIEGERAYRLIEDQSRYELTLVDPKDPLKQLLYKPLPFSSFGRYNATFWTSFHSNRVNGIITTIVNDFDPAPTYGPAKLSLVSLKVAYEALNYGIPDLRNIGLTWEGVKFSCAQNDIGTAIEGYLRLRPDGTPDYASYTLTRDGVKYSYKATFSFARSEEIPEFFPSRIKVEIIQGSSPGTISDYMITRLSLSERKLEASDVAFEPDTVPYPAYVYTNSRVYAVGLSNKLIELRSERSVSKESNYWNRRTTIRIILGMLLCSPLMIPIYFAISRSRKKRNKRENP